jgi:hypothetical protein
MIAYPIRPLLPARVNGYDLQGDITLLDVPLADSDCLHGISRNYLRNNHFAASDAFVVARSRRQCSSARFQPFLGGAERVLRRVVSPGWDPIRLPHAVCADRNDLQTPTLRGWFGSANRDGMPIFHYDNFGHHDNEILACLGGQPAAPARLIDVVNHLDGRGQANQAGQVLP